MLGGQDRKTVTEGGVGESPSLLQLKGWAIAYLHLTLQDFGLLRLPEYWAAIDAYWEEKNADRRHIGELIRGATARLFNLQVSEKYRVEDPADFWPMPWDEKKEKESEVEVIDRMTDEERDLLAQRFMDRLNGRKESQDNGDS